jgi:hypothetical protein
MTAEAARLEETRARRAHWRRWGPYLADRQWGTVREDYSAHGTAWDSFPHDHARSRVYRWGEDGILGISDNHQRLCFALALWNGRDPILKERYFGLTGPEGNHGEDVKEQYFYLDGTPTHAYMRGLYKYPQAEYPYARLVEENRRRDRRQPEFELLDTGAFDDGRYFDVIVEYAKAAPDDVLIRITVANRGPEPADLHVLPTLWFRNTWSWESGSPRPRLRAVGGRAGWQAIEAEHPTLGRRWLYAEGAGELLFTENETNRERLYGVPSETPYVKDAFHEHVVRGRSDAVNPAGVGTKAAVHHRLTLGAGEGATICLRLRDTAPNGDPFGKTFDALVERRRGEADEFYAGVIPASLSDDARGVMRQALAGMLWSKQWFHFDVRRWLEGDPPSPRPRPSAGAAATRSGRTSTTTTSSPCPTSGSTRGTRRGTSPSTPSRSPWWTRSSPRSSSSCSCASGTCTPTARSPPTSGRSATSTRRCTRGRRGACTRSTSACAAPATARSSSASSRSSC